MILSPDSDWLPQDLKNDSALTRHIKKAQAKVIRRYTQTVTRDDLLDVPLTGELKQVRLDGWAETEAGEPDPEAMDSGLLEALREVIADIVIHKMTAPGYAQSETMGDLSVTYRDGAHKLSGTVYNPLAAYDERILW